jgi:hypothetical protein
MASNGTMVRDDGGGSITCGKVSPRISKSLVIFAPYIMR